jgi:hypothetical protein
MVFFSFTRKILAQTLKIADDCLLPNPYFLTTYVYLPISFKALISEAKATS